MSRITPTPSRRTVITALSAAFLIPAATRSWAGTYVTIIAPTNIWSRLFKPNSALKIWSIYGDGNLAAPNRLRFELRPGDRYNNLSDIHNNRERTELSGSGSPFGFDETWQFTTSFKLSGYSGDSKWLVILQLLQIYNSATLPVLAIEVRSDQRWQVVVRGNNNANIENVLYVSSAPLAQGVSHSLTLKMRVGGASPSLLLVKLDGVTVISDSNAPMGFPSGGLPYFKLGLYRPASYDKCVMVHASPRLAQV